MDLRYDYSPITERTKFAWPDGKGLAVYVALNIESYAMGGDRIEELLPAGPQPEILNYSWCDYGNRVGVWRLKQLFDELDLPITLLVNSRIYAQAPQIVQAFRERGDEIACHGRTNSEVQGECSETAEELLIAEATKTMMVQEGRHPNGWLSPWISETCLTPDLLKAAGYSYFLDWCSDDQPVWFHTTSGPLLSVPYPQEINDSSSVIGRFVSASVFADMIVDQFEEMILQSVSQSLVMGIALHSHISGQPFRLRQLRRALTHVADRSRGQWLTRAGDIAQHFTRSVPPHKS